MRTLFALWGTLTVSACADCEDWICYVSDPINRGPPVVQILNPKADTPLPYAETQAYLVWVTDDETAAADLDVSVYLDDAHIDEETVLEDAAGAFSGTFGAEAGEHTLKVVASDEGGQVSDGDVTFTINESTVDTQAGDTAGADSGQ